MEARARAELRFTTSRVMTTCVRSEGLNPEKRADADELKAHLDAEIFKRGGREIGGVRVVEAGDCGEENFADLMVFEIGERLEAALVALADVLLGLVDRDRGRGF
jgi:hypothetical protein